MEAHTDQLNTLSDEAKHQVNMVNDAFAEGAEHITNYADQNTQMLDDAAKVVRHQLTELTASSDKALSKLEGASDIMRAKSEAIKDTSKSTVNAVMEVDKSVQKVSGNASRAAEKNLTKLREIGEALRKRTQEVSHASDLLDNKVTGSGDRLKDQLEELTESLGEAVKGIDTVGETVEQRARTAAYESKLAVQNMAKWTDAMEKGAADFSTTSNRITKDANKMVDNVKQQTEDLNDISKKARVISKSLQEHVELTGTEDFLKKMSLVSESLESVAIDINRVLETRLSEEDWQRYSKGDKGLFLRKILGIRNRAKLAKINKLHRQDAKFRQYVTRYISQFDSLISNAKRSGQDGALGGGFMTSDAGKVYMLLKAALELEPS